MAAFLVSLSVEVSDCDTPEEAARLFQGALPEYSMLDGMQFAVTGHITDDATEKTTVYVELPGRESPTQVLDAITARQSASELSPL